jgi:hypothetical protein
MGRCLHASLLMLWLIAACDVQGVQLVYPEDSDGSDTGFAIHVSLEDTALASALGWEVGVPGATVVIHRYIDPYQPDTFVTDGEGDAPLSGVLPGWYRVAGYRALAPEETGPTAGQIRAFGDGQKVYRHGPADINLHLRMDQAGSLVISEFFSGGATRELLGYNWAQFYELYNNADTTVYLDGMILGDAVGHAGSGTRTCGDPDIGPYREDPLGIWSRHLHQFPGQGRDYPVGPGETVLVAMDAVDHSVVDPSLPDLSGADFELEGTADTDNPDVPNMPDRSVRADPQGHGMLNYGTDIKYLALPVDVTSLVTGTILDYGHVRIPADKILDVTHGDPWTEPEAGPPPILVPLEYCNWINREFDRLEAPEARLGGDNRTSIHRRVLREAGGGRLILQDVNTSFVDWVRGLYTPGRIAY